MKVNYTQVTHLVLALPQFLPGSLQILECPDKSNSLVEWRRVPQVALPARQLQIERKPKCCLRAKSPKLDQLQRIAGAGPGTVRHGSGEIRWGHPQRIKERLFPPSLVEKTG